MVFVMFEFAIRRDQRRPFFVLLRSGSQATSTYNIRKRKKGEKEKEK